MKIPKYIMELMDRASFVLGAYEPGYTIKICKYSDYSSVDTLKKEIERLQKFIFREAGYPYDDGIDTPPFVINKIPAKTCHTRQYAIVTIYDPYMKYLEKYIPAKEKIHTKW